MPLVVSCFWFLLVVFFFLGGASARIDLKGR